VVVPGSFDDIETAVQQAYSPTTEASFVLTVEAGAERGQQLVIDAAVPAPVLVGQSPACSLRLSDRSVSRRHLALELDDQRLRARDLDSTNGTRVQGLRVADALLEGGELVEIGATTLRVTRQSAAPTTLTDASNFGRVVGASAEMRKLYPLLERLATTAIPVIIEGETGTGKEALAEAIHEAGPRAGGPFVVFDCTTAPHSLLESELFGHERGAFTGAVTARKGVFQQAHGGTLLIDEIGDLDIQLQPKLLRAIERSEVRPVGGSRAERVDVRVLAATRRDLDRAVQEGRFRDDLFHRLAVGRVELPPLRRRRGDVRTLAEHFWRELGGSGLPDAALLERCDQEPWPGNVRELRNTVARHLALGELATDISTSKPPADEPDGDFIDQVIDDELPLPVARHRVVEEFERRYIAAVLATHGGNVVHAAKASGIARRYFQLLRKKRSV